MEAQSAAPCRHEGAPREHVVEATARLIRNLGHQADLLMKHGLSHDEFVAALPGAIERVRGSSSASVADRKQFIRLLLQGLVDAGIASRLQVPKHGDATVYRLTIDGFGDVAIIQKGCPDGAHSSVAWAAPDWARETYLWWVCASMASHPGEHIAKGVNRLRQRFFGKYPDTLDGIIFHSALCGSAERLCPKKAHTAVLGGLTVPPPCVYVMPDRREGTSEWNWDGSTRRRFPELLLGAFGVSEEQAPSFVGHVGFRQNGSSESTVITSRFGPSRVTTYRS